MSSKYSFLRISLTGLVLAGMATAGFFIGKSQGNGPTAGAAWASPAFDTATRGKSLSMATGVIEVGTEALYTLDHLTGDLTCWILNARNGTVSAQFRVSAAAALGVSGEADYVMTTGFMDFSGGFDGSAKAAQSVVYVGDGNTGKTVGFVLLYNKQAIVRGDSTAGQLRLVCAMETRAVSIRDQGK